MRLIKIFLVGVLLTLTLSAREKVNVNFSDLQIKDFIKLVSKITHKNILVNYKINGTINFISTSPIYDDELLNLLISVLETKGFTLVKEGSIYQIVRSSDAAKHTTKVIPAYKTPNGSMMVTHTIKVKNENVDIVAAKIRYLLSKTAKMMTMKESNTILITDYPQNIATLKKVIKNINIKAKNVVEIIPIKHTEIKQLRNHLEIIKKSIFNQKIAEQKVSILVDENINGLIIVGAKKNVAIIKKLVAQLDKETPTKNKGVQIFPLKNSDAKNVLKSINDIISKQTFKDKTLKPHLSSNDEINAIIAIGDPTILKNIKTIIDELDQEKYQVYVKARILEINDRNAEQLGVKYGFGGAATKSIGSSSGLFSLATNFGGEMVPGMSYQQGMSAMQSTNSNFALGATLDFLESKGASKSISNPSILCVNNKSSSIYVGKTISVTSGQTSGASGTTASFKREDVGLLLKVKPRVSSLEKVTLEVEIKVEGITPDTIGNQPVTSKQEVKTQTILRDGESIVIGGLMKNYNSKAKSKVPLLGDIPWIGKWLFTSREIKKEKANLVVILTPYIIQKSENLSHLQEKLGILANIQKEYDKKVFQKIEQRAKKQSEK